MPEHAVIAKVETVALYPSDAPSAHEATLQAARWLRAEGVAVHVPPSWLEGTQADRLPPGCGTISETADDMFDLVMAFGGDGTLMRAARMVADRGIPVVGINLGTLGFLSAFTASEAEEAAKAAVEGRLTWEARLRMQVEVRRQGRVCSRQSACNDAYVKHGANPRMLQLSTVVGGDKMADYRADGLIVATPTGSTAYNLAAGGPILDPGTDAFVITPICPHSLTHRPVVTSAQSPIGITYAGPTEAGEATLSVDGQTNVPLEVGDEIVVRRAATPLKLVPPSTSVFAVLRDKLGWSGAGTQRESSSS